MLFTTSVKSIKGWEFAYRSFWLFLAKVIPTLTYLLTTILYSRELSLSDYGMYQSVWMYVNVIVILLNFGAYQIILSTSYNSVITFLKANKKKIFILYLSLTSCIVLFFLTSAKSFSPSIKLVVVSSIIFQVTTIFFEAILINNKKEKYVFTINTFYSIIFLTWHIYLLRSEFNLQFLIQGILILGLIRLASFWILSRPSFFEKRTVAIPVNHWFFIGLNDVVNNLTKWMDKLILIYFLQPPEFAIFFNGSIEIPIFGILVSVIGSLLLVDISSNLAWKPKVIELLKNTFLISSHVIFPLFWFLAFYKSEIFQILFDGKYNASVEIFMVTLLVVPLRVTNYSAILQCYNKADLILKGSILDIMIAVVLIPLLYTILGLKGVALAIVISTYIQSYFYLYHSSQVLNTSVLKLIPLATLLIRFIISMLFFVALQFMIKNLPIYSKLFIATTFSLVLILSNLAIAYFPALKKARN